VKLAMETRSKLVPMAVFGESQLLDNPFDLPTAQVYHRQLQHSTVSNCFVHYCTGVAIYYRCDGH